MTAQLVPFRAAAALANQHDIQASRVLGAIGDGMRTSTDNGTEGGQESDEQPGTIRPRCEAPRSGQPHRPSHGTRASLMPPPPRPNRRR